MQRGMQKFWLLVFVGCLVFFGSLFAFSVVLAQTGPPALPAPPSDPVNPENETSSVAFPLTLEWEEAPGAESYFYNIFGMQEPFLVTEEASGRLPEEVLEFLAPESYANYRQACQEAKGEPCSGEEIHKKIVQGQVYHWQVKTCTIPEPQNSDDHSCGPYSTPLWSFVYMPLPPENLEQPSPEASGVPFPVKLTWANIESVGSYIVHVEVDTGCSTWDHTVGFFLGGFGIQKECDPATLFADVLEDWLGIGEGYDTSCPWPLWSGAWSEQQNFTTGDTTVDRDPKECFMLPIRPLSAQDEAKPEYLDDGCIFSKNAPYLVRVASCLDKTAQICGAWSEQRSFTTGDTTVEGTPYILSTPELLEPEFDSEKPLEVPVVGKTHFLRWKGGACGGYIHLLIHSQGIQVLNTILPNFDAITLAEGKMKDLWDESSDLNKEYTWKLRPCWRVKDDIHCETGVSSFNNEWSFKTIGEPPLLEGPTNNEFLKIPGTLSWQHIDGVGSYLVQVAEDAGFAQEIKKKARKGSSFVLSLDDFEPDKQYWWRIKTCADEMGKVCGNNWSEERSFHTHDLKLPTEPTPGNGDQFSLPGTLKWKPDPGASFYQYRVEYKTVDPGETLEGCAEKAGGTQLIPRPGEPHPTTTQTSFYLNEQCAGTYKWAVRSCAEEACDETKTPPTASPWSPLWTFTTQEPPEQERFGLVPCARNSNNPTTPYNEKEACGLKHVGFLLQNILDFVLWKLSLIVLAALAVVAAASTFFSFGSPDVITRMRAIFRSYLYGVLILVFAWAIVNIIMAVFGFNITFFGIWYEIPF